MNCRGSGTSAASGNTPWLPRALERHAVPERLMMVDAALSSLVEHIRKRLVRGADHGTNSARGNSLGGAATFYESSVQSVPLSSSGALDAHARAARVYW